MLPIEEAGLYESYQVNLLFFKKAIKSSQASLLSLIGLIASKSADHSCSVQAGNSVRTLKSNTSLLGVFLSNRVL